MQGANFIAENTLAILKDKDSDEQTRLSRAIKWCEDTLKIIEERKSNDNNIKKENT